MEAVGCSETLVDFRQAIRRYIPEDDTFKDLIYKCRYTYTTRAAREDVAVGIFTDAYHQKLLEIVLFKR
jgi:hypothetical protein